MDEDDGRQVCVGACGHMQRVEAVAANIGQLANVRRLGLDGARTELCGDGEGREHGDEDGEDDEQGETDTGEGEHTG